MRLPALKSIRTRIALLALASSVFLYSSLSPATPIESTCSTAFAQVDSGAIRSTPIQWNRENRSRALHIMLTGSLNVSRTKVLGRRFLAPVELSEHTISVKAESNFTEAARYVVENLENLEISKETAIKLNRILTQGLVPENKRGNPFFRVGAEYAGRADHFIGNTPQKFYSWLDSEEAKELARRDPVGFAEVLHNTIVALDSFPDGNGRLSRLFADLALLKSGNPPAFYTDMKDYFERGSARASLSRADRILYFKEIVDRGRRAFIDPLENAPSQVQR